MIGFALVPDDLETERKTATTQPGGNGDGGYTKQCPDGAEAGVTGGLERAGGLACRWRRHHRVVVIQKAREVALQRFTFAHGALVFRDRDALAFVQRLVYDGMNLVAMVGAHASRRGRRLMQ